jgi:ribosomal protein S18 acetylase RimI-like enzyme
LQVMLYEAANRPGHDWPDFETSINEDRNKRFWVDWPRQGDIGVIAERNGTPLAAAWIRRFRGHELSPLDEPGVPVLAIGVVREHRGRGVGGLLMDALINEAHRSGVAKIALSTGLFNEAALRLYRRHGFKEVARRDDGVRMLAVLQQQRS